MKDQELLDTLQYYKSRIDSRQWKAIGDKVFNVDKQDNYTTVVDIEIWKNPEDHAQFITFIHNNLDSIIAILQEKAKQNDSGSSC